MITFKYKEESVGVGKGKVIRPVADVFLKTKSDSWIEFHPYIDSGADITMIPLSLGKLLGLRIEEKKMQQIGGIRGSVPIMYTKINMSIGGIQFNTNIAWSLIEDVPPLLGRKDVFDIFRVTFEQYKKIIIFEQKMRTK